MSCHQPLSLLLLVFSCYAQTFDRPLQVLREALGLDFIPERQPADEYDFIIVGAGSAGCLLASRLSEIPNFSILLIEAGRQESPLTDIPLLVSYMLGTDYNWGYRTQPQSGACGAMNGRRCAWPRGRAVGGTSVVNYMVYTRGFPADFDEWAALGNPGWAYNDIFPYYLRLENAPDGMRGWYGKGGPLEIERPRWRTPLARAFVNAGQAAMGPPVEGLTAKGFDYVLATTKRGSRVSSARAFLRPVSGRPNLALAARTRVTRVFLDTDGRRARGVEISTGGIRRLVRARREVILSAGTLGSAQLLMLSGIGTKGDLAEVGIKPRIDLPVGRRLRDHVSMAGLVFTINASLSIIEARYRRPRYALDYLFNGRGPYTLPGGAEALAFLRSDSNKTATPDLELVFGPGAFTGDSGGSLMRSFNINRTFFEQTFGNYRGRDAFSIVPVLLKPKSVGYMRLRSSDPFAEPLFYPNYFTHPDDVRRLIIGIRKAIEIGESKPFKRWGSRVIRKPMMGCEKSQWGTDAYWECVLRTLTTNLHHQVGTCPMGPDGDEFAVVDSELRVKGITGLRVVDASIMPTIPAAHTIAVVYMIAEKAAELIKAEYNNVTSNDV